MTATIRQLTDGCKLEDESQAVSFRLDAAGHWSTFRSGQYFYRRCVDGRIVQGAMAEPLTPPQTDQVYQQAFQFLRALNTSDPLVQKSREYSPAHYQQLRQQYFDVYPEPVSILPPDRYADIVVQPAKGCPNRQCTFCAFYQDKPYSVLNKKQLKHHLDGLESLFGEALYKRQGVFLGSANAMALSQRRLRDCLHEINQRFGLLRRGIATFADPDFSAPRTTSDWEQLSVLGLSQVVIGLETGWQELRARLGKSGNLDKVSAMICAARSAGIRVGLTVLTGAATKSEQVTNIAQTVKYLQSLPLTGQDIIYLSPLDQNGLVEIRALDELDQFNVELKKLLRAKVVQYQMQRFNYYA